MARRVVKKEVVKRIAVRSAKASAKLENRTVPAGYVRSASVKKFLAGATASVLMPLTPGYGDTPLPDEELEALLPHIVAELLEEPVSKAAIYDLEQGVQEQVTEELLAAVLDGTLALDELVNDFFSAGSARSATRRYMELAGVWRRHELNIGVAPEQVAVELRNSLDTIRYRWEHTTDWTARELGIAVHAEAVRVHPCLAVIVSQQVGIGF